jgi:regulator of replication initiation timing
MKYEIDEEDHIFEVEKESLRRRLESILTLSPEQLDQYLKKENERLRMENERLRMEMENASLKAALDKDETKQV